MNEYAFISVSESIAKYGFLFMSKLDLTYAVWDVDGAVGTALESPVAESEYSGTDTHPARLKATAAVKMTEINLEYFLCIKIPFRSDYLKGIISKNL
jgi:hypothetical protein